MKRYLISVIIAIYNSSKWIRKCIDSLLEQTFHDFELIQIDDGSRDGASEISDEYTILDSRLFVVHKANGGVATARQTGHEIASGEYVIHADPDDWCEPEMLEEMLQEAQRSQTDMVICDFYMNFQDGRPQYYYRQQPANLDKESVLDELFGRKLYGSLWNKLIRRKIIVNNGIRFPLELNYCEDLFVTAWCALLAKKITYLPKAFYHYEVGMPQSLVNSENAHHSIQNIVMFHRNCLRDYPRPYNENVALLYELRGYRAILMDGSEEYLRYFDRSFSILRKNYWQCRLTFFQKILLFIAFHTSASFAHRLMKLRLSNKHSSS